MTPQTLLGRAIVAVLVVGGVAIGSVAQPAAETAAAQPAEQAVRLTPVAPQSVGYPISVAPATTSGQGVQSRQSQVSQVRAELDASQQRIANQDSATSINTLVSGKWG